MLLGFFPDKDSPAASMPLMTAFSFDGNIVSAIWDASFGAMLFGNIKYNYVLWTIGIEFLVLYWYTDLYLCLVRIRPFFAGCRLFHLFACFCLVVLM